MARLYRQPYATRETVDVYQDESGKFWMVGARRHIQEVLNDGWVSVVQERVRHFLLGIIVEQQGGWVIHNEPLMPVFPSKAAAIDALLVLREISA